MNIEWWKQNKLLIIALMITGFLISISDRIYTPLSWWETIVLIFVIIIITGGVFSWVLSKMLKHYRTELKTE
jgi:hypothetical protein